MIRNSARNNEYIDGAEAILDADNGRCGCPCSELCTLLNFSFLTFSGEKGMKPERRPVLWNPNFNYKKVNLRSFDMYSGNKRYSSTKTLLTYHMDSVGSAVYVSEWAPMDVCLGYLSA